MLVWVSYFSMVAVLVELGNGEGDLFIFNSHRKAYRHSTLPDSLVKGLGLVCHDYSLIAWWEERLLSPLELRGQLGE